MHQKQTQIHPFLFIHIHVCVNFVYLSFADKPAWQQQWPLFTKYGETINLTNISAPSPSFGKVPSSIEVMPGQTVVLSCIVNNLRDRTVRNVCSKLTN